MKYRAFCTCGREHRWGFSLLAVCPCGKILETQTQREFQEAATLYGKRIALICTLNDAICLKGTK